MPFGTTEIWTTLERSGGQNVTHNFSSKTSILICASSSSFPQIVLLFESLIVGSISSCIHSIHHHDID
uniref:Uncharacterized protein n=1 Tax=Physcomitrium patens TaxID=3218 RepID=A0A2K1KZP3_PHYPA|nr:hypothetical protein PHYPA_002030 [Physcomitrium patens]